MATNVRLKSFNENLVEKLNKHEIIENPEQDLRDFLQSLPK